MLCAIPAMFLRRRTPTSTTPPLPRCTRRTRSRAKKRPLRAGAKLYAANCVACHGAAGRGSGNIPALYQGPTQSAPDGEVFWFITTGSVANGMPAWGSLSEQQRWQIVAYLKSLKSSADGKQTRAGACEHHSGENRRRLCPNLRTRIFALNSPGRSAKFPPQDLPAPYAYRLRQQWRPARGSPRGCLAESPGRFHRPAIRDRPRQSAPDPHRS